MIISSIDIGSNTVLMLIAEYDTKLREIKTIKNFYEMPRISSGLSAGKPVSTEKIGELMNILRRFRSYSADNNSEKIIISATNAFRIASNSKEIINRIKNELDLEINVLSGIEEAYYSYMGAFTSSGTGKETLVIDIGGGSTELTYGIGGEIKDTVSSPLGVVSLKNKYFNSDPPLNAEIRRCIKGITTTIADSGLGIKDGVKAVAVAGTPTTLSCMKQGLKVYNEELVENSNLTIQDLENSIEVLSNLTFSEIAERFGSVTEGRSDLLLAGALILYNILRRYNINEVLVSNKGLRYGAIISHFNR